MFIAIEHNENYYEVAWLPQDESEIIRDSASALRMVTILNRFVLMPPEIVGSFFRLEINEFEREEVLSTDTLDTLAGEARLAFLRFVTANVDAMEGG